MALIVDIGVSQSYDGSKLTFLDKSNWSDSGLDINDYTRIIELYDNTDATGNLIATIPFVDDNISVVYPIAKDQYFSAKFIVSNDDTSDITGIKTINFGTTNFEYKNLNILTSKGCGCGNKTNDEKARYGFIYLKLAEKSLLFGNSGQFNQNIQKSATWLQ